jgi:phosphinothricin acetyltransferase
VRQARPGDAPTIAAIYNEGIRGRGATFETRERSAAEIEGWFTPPPGPIAFPVHPFFVAECDGVVSGWVHASVYRPREAYRRIAEYSIYVAGSARGRGVGDALMAEFLPACEAAGITKLIARIFPENRASLALCTRHGFRTVGTYERHAMLDGVWRDVVIVEKCLGEARRP